MKETSGSLRIYFGICAAFQLYGALTLFASLTLYGVLLGLIDLGLAALLGYITFRLPQMLVTDTRLVTVALAIGVGGCVVNTAIALALHAGLGSVVQLVVVIAVSAYLYRSVQRLSAEARAGSGSAPTGQMTAPPGYGAPQLQQAPSPYGQPHEQPYLAPAAYGQQQQQQQEPPPPMYQQQPLGPGVNVIVTAPDGRRTPAVILQEQNGYFLCDSQGGQGWVPAQLVTRA